MPTDQEIKEQAEKEAAEKADSAAAEATLKEIDELAEKGEGVKEDGFIKVKKSQIHKLASDRNNYRKATLDKKATERELNNKGGDGKGGDDNKGAATVDETKVKEIATSAANTAVSDIYKSNENRAKRAFLKAHGEYLDDAQWTALMSNFHSKRGKVTPEDVLEDMEDALLVHKRGTGELDKHLEKMREQGRNEGRIDAELNTGHNAGGAGDRNGGAGTAGKLSPKGEEMARGMHVDPEKVKKVDPSKDNVIKVV